MEIEKNITPPSEKTEGDSDITEVGIPESKLPGFEKPPRPPQNNLLGSTFPGQQIFNLSKTELTDSEEGEIKNKLPGFEKPPTPPPK